MTQENPRSTGRMVTRTLDNQSAMPAEVSLQPLEAFVLDNRELATLEERLSQFNIFEALNIVHQEIRHSNFLKWLLDPLETHGLSSTFLMAFLVHTLSKGRQLHMDVPSPVRVYGLDLEQTHLARETENIDVLAVNDTEKIVLVIENKVDAVEHGDQLARYARVVDTQFPEYKSVFVYLSPEPPAELHSRYIPISYEDVAKLIDRLLAEKEDVLGEAIRLIIGHYRDLLRRYIVPESDIGELCRRIYKKHRRALDLIFEHRPDLQSDISTFLAELVKTHDGLVLDAVSKTYVRFAPKSWDPLFLRVGAGWTPSGRLVLFEFDNSPHRLGLRLVIGPGDSAARAMVFEHARSRKEVFAASSKLYERWTTIASFKFLDKDQLEADWETIRNQIEKRWNDFLRVHLSRIEPAFHGLPLLAKSEG